MLWSNQLSNEQLEILIQKGALQLGHNYKKYQRGKSGQWQTLKYTRLFLDEEKQYELFLVGTNSGLDQKGVYYLKSSVEGFSLNGRLSYGAYLHIGDRVIIKQDIYQFKKNESLQYSTYGLTEAIVQSDATVLLIGETGTGKGHLAKKIFELRKHIRPWVHVNIASLAPSLVESEIFGHVKGAFTGAHQENAGALKTADQSVLFLDEIDSLPMEQQSKLLVFLDEYKFKAVGSQKEVQVKLKLLVASGQNLEPLVEQGKFRKDLYYRLVSGFSISLPSLKNKAQLIEQFCLDFAQKNQAIIDPLLIEFYQKMSWPGNYRQLKSHLDRKLRINMESKHLYFNQDDQALMGVYLDQNLLAQTQKFVNLNQQKRSYAQHVYQELLGDITLTAKTLQVSPKTLKCLLSSQICS